LCCIDITLVPWFHKWLTFLLLYNVVLNLLQRLNIRCNPQDVLVCIQIMNERQRQAVVRKGFFSILDMTIDALGSRTHLCWLMEKLDPKDMTLRIGPGKELKITKETVHLILGLPNTGGGKPLNIDEVNAAVNLRSSLGISKDEFGVAKLQERLRLGGDDDLSIRCFFLILFNRLLFPTASWSISNNEVLLTEQLDRFPHIDWCHLIFNDLCEAAHKWHNRSTTNVSATIYGCSIVVLVSFLMSAGYSFHSLHCKLPKFEVYTYLFYAILSLCTYDSPNINIFIGVLPGPPPPRCSPQQQKRHTAYQIF
jgi:hypothetical protein